MAFKARALLSALLLAATGVKVQAADGLQVDLDSTGENPSPSLSDTRDTRLQEHR